LKKARANPPAKKGAARQKQMGALEKEVISTAMNVMSEETLAKITDIIKSKMDGLEIDPITGEIELEIEQIPQDILYELYKIISAKHPDIEIGLRKQHEKVAAPQPLARPPPKKKNKPMSKNEQEKKIEQLNRKMADFHERKASGSPAAQTAPQPVLPTIEKQEEPESSGDDASDSEEE